MAKTRLNERLLQLSGVVPMRHNCFINNSDLPSFRANDIKLKSNLHEVKTVGQSVYSPLGKKYEVLKLYDGFVLLESKEDTLRKSNPLPEGWVLNKENEDHSSHNSPLEYFYNKITQSCDEIIKNNENDFNSILELEEILEDLLSLSKETDDGKIRSRARNVFNVIRQKLESKTENTYQEIKRIAKQLIEN